MKDNLGWEMNFVKRHPLIEDTFDGRQPLMEDNLIQKTAIIGRQPFVEAYVRWKLTFNGGQLQCQTTIYGKLPSTDDDV